MNAQLPRIHTPTDDAIASFGNNYGSPQYGLALTGVLYAGGLIDHNPSLRDDGVMLLESLGFAGAVTTVGKTIIGRARPYTEEGIASFTPLSFNTEHTSLPSGHTTVAFSVSTILAEEIGNTYASIALYGIAGITVYARVYTDEHWVSDTFLGAAIGTTSGILVYHLHHHDGDGSSEASLHITPSLNGVDVALIF
jgi:membrane-associated phospholipid phosphatase